MLNSKQLLMGVSSFAEQEWHGVIASATVSPVSVSHQLHRCLTAQSGLCLSVCLDSCLQLYGCRGSECVRIIIMMCPTLWPLLWSVIHVVWACARVVWALGLIDLGSACAGQLLVLVFRGWTHCPMHLPFSFESQCSAAQIVRLLSYSRWLRCLMGCVCGYHSWILWQWACTNPARAGVVLCAAFTGIFRFLVSVSYSG